MFYVPLVTLLSIYFILHTECLQMSSTLIILGLASGKKILLQQSLEVLSDHDHGKQAGHLLWLQ